MDLMLGDSGKEPSPPTLGLSDFEQKIKEIIEAKRKRVHEGKEEDISEYDYAFVEDDDEISKVKITHTEIERGSFGGLLVLECEGKILDATSAYETGYTIPSLEYLSKITIIKGGGKAEAKFVLFVNKWCPFYYIMSDEFYKTFPWIVIYVKGFPDEATIRFVEKVTSELDLSIYAFIDSDPYSLLSVFALGAKWLGLRPTELAKNPISDYSTFEMTEPDIEVVKYLLSAGFANGSPARVDELLFMLQHRRKAEIDALCCDGMFNNFVRTYLPKKLKDADWI